MSESKSPSTAELQKEIDDLRSAMVVKAATSAPALKETPMPEKVATPAGALREPRTYRLDSGAVCTDY